jgi:hypothetical protein
MKALAFTFSTNGLYYVVLTGTKQHPVFNEKNKIILPVNHTIPQLVEWYETQLALILDSITPNSVSYKLTINNVTNNFVSNVYYGQAILILLCQKRALSISHTSPSSIVCSRFNQPKGTDLHDYINHLIGQHPPHWDDKMKDTALISLNLLP